MIFPHFKMFAIQMFGKTNWDACPQVLNGNYQYLNASHHLETQATTSATGKTNCAVLESCFTSPFTCTTPANQ